MMSPLLACLVLVFAAGVSAKDVDLTDDKYFIFTARIPDESSHKTLEIYNIYSRKDVMRSITEIMDMVSEEGGDEPNQLLAVVNRTGTFKSDYGENFWVYGKLDRPSHGFAKLSLASYDKNGGLCRTYLSRVTGIDAGGVERVLSKTLTVGYYGNAKCEVADYIKEAFPHETLVQQLQIQDKILAIDSDTYNVSGIYQGRVYIATMNDTTFELDKMNELCKSAGGYLVELDSHEEQFFVRDFLKSLGRYHYFTGANDVDSEGDFVYYNSKKPVTNVVWQQGEPNNGGGNEKCVEILKRGLNDQTCTKKRGYICEIPLFEQVQQLVAT